jgi:sulfate adenylyltransferase
LRAPGLTVFLTGLPGAGKSTTASTLGAMLEAAGREVTVFDGDEVRARLSPQLGFSRRDRDINVHRIGQLAAEVVAAGDVAVCAQIAPYDAARKDVRRMIEEAGGEFVLVHVATPLDTCERRDGKGLYTKARLGLVQNFTGISDPYELPADADIAIDTSESSPDEVAKTVWSHLEQAGYVDVTPRSRR